jgi:hypothetical protein
MAQHRHTNFADNHSPISFTAADLSARENYAVTADDNGRVLWQQDNDSFWILKDSTLAPTARWIPFGLDPNAATKAYVDQKVAEIEAELAAI